MKQYLCDICNQSFSNKSNLNRHTKSIHGDKQLEKVADFTSQIVIKIIILVSNDYFEKFWFIWGKIVNFEAKIAICKIKIDISEKKL